MDKQQLMQAWFGTLEQLAQVNMQERLIEQQLNKLGTRKDLLLDQVHELSLELKKLEDAEKESNEA